MPDDPYAQYQSAPDPYAAYQTPPSKVKAHVPIWDDPDMGSPEPSMQPGLPGHPGVDITTGLKQIGSGEFSKGANNLFSGAGKIASVALPEAAVAAPAALAGGMVGGGIGHGVGSTAASLMGATPDQQELAGNALSIPGGAAGSVLGGKLGNAVSSIGKLMTRHLRDASPEQVEAAKKGLIDMIPYWGAKINKQVDIFNPPPEPFQPFRANPNVANKMPFGGPFQEYKGKSYRSRSVGMGGAPEPPAPEVAPEPTPFEAVKPNPNISRKLKYGGSADEIYGEAKPSIPSRIAGTPSSDLPTVRQPSAPSPMRQPYQGPNKVNPNISRKLKFSPGGEDQYKGSAGDQAGSTLGTRAEMMRQVRLKRAANDPLDLQKYIDVEPNQ